MNSAPPRWFSRTLILIIASAVLIRLFYWIYTHRTWEDALITVLHSENFVRGLGLTHVKPGEPPLHGFTSPLSVLLPLLGDLVHVGFGLSFLKFLSALCGGIAAWLGARISLKLGLPPALALTAAAFLAFEHHQIMWGMAGMETQVATVAYLYSIYCFLYGNQWQKGLSLGFVMLARPDAAIWVAIAFTVELRRAWKSGTWRRLVAVLGGLTLLYAPWLIFTLLYYGSPIPNTILAKSVGSPSVFARMGKLPALGKLLLVARRFSTVISTLGPAYGGNGIGFQHFWDHHMISRLAALLGILGAVAALRKRHFEGLLVYAFLGAYSLYLTFGPGTIYGWYTGPVAAVGIIGITYALRQMLEPFAAQRLRERVAAGVGVAYIASIVMILPATMRSDKNIQRYVEDEGRAEIGRYLGSVAKASDTIGLEPLGYVSYYSRRPVYDYPGMSSRKVVQYLREHPQERNLVSMLGYLRPTFLVLRPFDYLTADGRMLYPWIDQDYELLRVFKVPAEKQRQILHPEHNIDFEFHVFRSKSGNGRLGASASAISPPAVP
jgi:hypothetical protein